MSNLRILDSTSTFFYTLLLGLVSLHFFRLPDYDLDMLGYICKKRTLGAFTRTYIQKLPSTCLRVRGSTCSVWQAEPIKTTPAKIVRLMHTISLSFCHVSQFDRCTTRRSMCCPNRVLAWYARLF